ncbi:MAG: cytochrome P460 family protein [Bacteroidota bacterium]|nr:cytochrome P460 family protein [Bacteroidota bacterium]
MRKKLLVTLLSLTIVTILSITSCKKDEVAVGTDRNLYDMARATAGFTWYKNSSNQLNRSSGSGHPQPFLRTRYNSIAAAKLDSDGKIVAGTNFPEGSLIVKELNNNSGNTERYAVLYKNSGNPDADAKGWVWGYVNSDGSVDIPASKKGSSCIGCHSQVENIDYMLMNKYF